MGIAPCRRSCVSEDTFTVYVVVDDPNNAKLIGQVETLIAMVERLNKS